MLVRCISITDGMFSGNKFARIINKETGGFEEIEVPENQIYCLEDKFYLKVGFIRNTPELGNLIEFPRESSRGLWRIWVDWELCLDLDAPDTVLVKCTRSPGCIPDQSVIRFYEAAGILIELTVPNDLMEYSHVKLQLVRKGANTSTVKLPYPPMNRLSSDRVVTIDNSLIYTPKDRVKDFISFNDAKNYIYDQKITENDYMITQRQIMSTAQEIQQCLDTAKMKEKYSVDWDEVEMFNEQLHQPKVKLTPTGPLPRSFEVRNAYTRELYCSIMGPVIPYIRGIINFEKESGEIVSFMVLRVEYSYFSNSPATEIIILVTPYRND